MAVHIKDVEVMHKLLVEARQIFSDLNGDSIVALRKMERWCTKCDDILNK